MDRTRMGRRVALALGTSALLVGSVAAPAFANDVITQGITAGSLIASVGSVDVHVPTPYSHSAHSVAGSMTLTVDDTSGSNAGWHVTIQTSDFVWSVGDGGASTGLDIPAANFLLTSAATPVSTAGQAVDNTDGPKVGTAIGSFGGPLVPITANATFGNGTYTQLLGVQLDIPAYSAAGTYTGTLVVTHAATP